MSSLASGSLAEEKVARMLVAQGYKVLEKNWKVKIAEIDIVAKKDDTLYFVEVKYRQTNQAGDGFDYITPSKLKHMRRAAEAYVSYSSWAGPYTLWAASVIDGLENPTIELVEI